MKTFLLLLLAVACVIAALDVARIRHDNRTKKDE